MRPAPPLSAAAALAVALWQVVRTTPLADRAAPGLWWWLDRIGAVEPFAYLLPIVAAGVVVAALVQPTMHVRHARPWAEAVTLALLVPGLLLPVPVALLVAAVPLALCTKAARPVAIYLTTAIVVPPVGPVALAMAIWHLSVALRLPPHANDNAPVAIRA